jgi:ABC-type lipoprotein release transport system permease subunit
VSGRRGFLSHSSIWPESGWLIGIPLGYLLDRFLVWLLNTVLNLNITLAFPPWNLALTLADTILLAFLITLVPIERAARLRPGATLRHA